MKIHFKVKYKDFNEPSWKESYEYKGDRDTINTRLDIESVILKLIDDFNEEEVDRYGDSAQLREFVEIIGLQILPDEDILYCGHTTGIVSIGPNIQNINIEGTRTGRLRVDKPNPCSGKICDDLDHEAGVHYYPGDRCDYQDETFICVPYRELGEESMVMRRIVSESDNGVVNIEYKHGEEELIYTTGVEYPTVIKILKTDE